MYYIMSFLSCQLAVYTVDPPTVCRASQLRYQANQRPADDLLLPLALVLGKRADLEETLAGTPHQGSSLVR